MLLPKCYAILNSPDVDAAAGFHIHLRERHQSTHITLGTKEGEKY